MKKLALYIHWPFCVSKCPYCDFASRPLPKGVEEGAFAAAYEKEMAFEAARTGPRLLSSIYFGGGTPSLMKPETVHRLIESAARFWPLAATCEITLEANPTSAEKEKFRAFRAAGVNRLSLGVQSFDDDALRFLGRSHDAATARAALSSAAQVFDRFSFDLIYACRGQTFENWHSELREALSFGSKHLSAYQLTIEPGTVFYKKARNEVLQIAEEDAVRMFEATQDILGEAGLPAYEISNHAVVGEESRHNLTYWRYEDYVGLGPSAQGRFVDGEGQRLATENIAQPEAWLAQVQTQGRGRAAEEALDIETAQREALMMGLRLAEGINLAAWQEKFSTALDAFLEKEKVEKLIEENLIEKRQTHFRATAAGREKLNAVLAFLF